MQFRKLQGSISAEDGSTDNLEDRGTVTLVCHIRQVCHTKKHFIFHYQVGGDCLALFQATLDLEITFLPSPGVNGLRGQQCHTIIAIVRREIYILRGCLGHQLIQQLDFWILSINKLVLSETSC